MMLADVFRVGQRLNFAVQYQGSEKLAAGSRLANAASGSHPAGALLTTETVRWIAPGHVVRSPELLRRPLDHGSLQLTLEDQIDDQHRDDGDHHGGKQCAEVD